MKGGTYPEIAVNSENHQTMGTDRNCMHTTPEFCKTHTDIATFILAQHSQLEDGKH